MINDSEEASGKSETKIYVEEKNDESSTSSSNKELVNLYRKRMTNIIYPLVSNYDEIDQDLDIYDVVPSYDWRKFDNNTLNLTPIYGTLLPYECQIISLSYKPKFGKSVNAICNCYIEGGENKQLEVHGCCLKMNYETQNNVIEFGFQVKF